MARQKSPDPVAKITISLPKSLHDRAKKRALEFKETFSGYIQLLIGSDSVLRPNQLHKLDQDGSVILVSKQEKPLADYLKVAEEPENNTRR